MINFSELSKTMANNLKAAGDNANMNKMISCCQDCITCCNDCITNSQDAACVSMCQDMIKTMNACIDTCKNCMT
jgi:hypothetical protein